MDACGFALLVASAMGQVTPAPALPAPQPGPAPKPVPAETPAQRLAKLVKEFDDAQRAFDERYGAAKDDAEREKLYRDAYPAPERSAPRFAALGRELKGDPVALDAWTWIVQHVQTRELVEPCLEAILADHVASPKLVVVVQSISPYAPSLATEKFLRAVVAKSPDWDVKGHATFRLATVLNALAGAADSLEAMVDGNAADAEKRAQFVAWYGKETVDELAALDPDELRKEAEDLLEDVVAQYASVASGGDTLGKQAAGELFELRHLALGRVAPEVIGQDVDGVAFKLSDYRGKVVVLDFWGFW